jgi:drug/metabolite transporter (DMT)-like permease
LAATFTVINARLVESGKPLHISVQELSAGCVAVLIYLFVRDGWDFWPEHISSWDWFNLAVLGVVATSFAFVVSVDVMREISPFTVALTINLEPVYTIFLALLIYGEEEHMSGGFYLGTAVLLGTVFLQTILSRRKKSAAKAVAQANSSVD